MIEIPYRILGEDVSLWPADRDPRIVMGFEFANCAAILAETQHERAFSPHSHGDHRVMLTVQGVEKQWLSGSSRREFPGAISLIPADVVHHSIIETERLTFLSIAIDGRTPLMSHAGPYLSGLQLGLAWRIYHELLGGAKAHPLYVEALCLELELSLADRTPPGRAEPDWLLRAFEMLMDDSRVDHSSATLARAVGVHRCHLARVFFDRFGCSVHELLIARRLQRSLTSLCKPELTLTEVAQDCGFYDQSHYTRHFRRNFGATPGHVRSSFGIRRGNV